MQRMHNWYMRACRLGLRTLCAPYHPQVFRLQSNGIMDVMFDFEDIHNIFRLGELDIKMVRLWCEDILYAMALITIYAYLIN
jgi:hypothetical protein